MTEDNNENSNIIKGGFKFTDIYKYLNDSDTQSLQKYLDANEIQNHAQLEPIFLLTWNTSLAMKIFKGLIDDSFKKMNESMEKNGLVIDTNLKKFENEIQSVVNQQVDVINSALTKNVDEVNANIASVYEKVISFTDNISTYIDTSFAKFDDYHEKQRIETAQQIQSLIELAKQQLQQEIQSMIIQLINTELKKELQTYVREPLKQFSSHYGKMLEDKVIKHNALDKQSILINVVTSAITMTIVLVISKFF